MLDDISPLHNHNGFRVIGDFCQLIGDNTHLVQAIKIKMVHFQVTSLVQFANRKRRTGYPISTLQATGQATDPTAVVMAVERAQLAMQLASQIRTKAVEAAQDIFHTQV